MGVVIEMVRKKTFKRLIKEKIQRYINFPDKESKENLDKLLDELYNLGVGDGNKLKNNKK